MGVGTLELIVRIKKILRDFTLDVDFTVRDEIFALLGESGCGKSMTLKSIAGIETPDSGEIILNGLTLFDSAKKINLPPQARRAGYLFQNYALFPNMTVAENILFAATDDKISKLEENLQRFQLRGLENAYPRELSGGQQQRVAFARVLASHAEILLLDEPFAALDSHLRWQLETELTEIFKLYGAAILVSHDRGEVRRLADKVAVLRDGKIDSLGTVQEVFTRPKTLAAAILTGCENISHAKKISDKKIFAVDWQLELTAENIPADLNFIGIRARELELIPNPLSLIPNTFAAQIVNVIEDTENFIVMIRAGGGKLIRWDVDKKFIRAIQDEEIFLHVEPEKIILLR